MATEVKKDPRRSKPKFGSLNEHLICALCSGYLVDATTIIECLHSFCRSCIVQYLQSSSVCPTCKVQLDKGCPLRSLKPDKTLQDIVYKLVPNLFTTEMQRRKVYYDSHPQYVDQTTPEQRGDSIERFYSPDDTISLSLEYHGKRRLSLDSDDSGVNLNNNDEKTVPQKRYLKCPALFTIGLLKKFIRLKFDLPSDFVIDIFQRESYPDDYTLLDIAYIYPWKRSEPMRFFYHVRDPRVPEYNDEVEREMPSLSAVIGTRAGRAIRRASAASQSAISPGSSPRISPALVARKPRIQPTLPKNEHLQPDIDLNGPSTSRHLNSRTPVSASGLVSGKPIRASPAVKVLKSPCEIPTRGPVSPSVAEMPDESPASKPSTTDFANGSRCVKPCACGKGSQCSKCRGNESLPRIQQLPKLSHDTNNAAKCKNSDIHSELSVVNSVALHVESASKKGEEILCLQTSTENPTRNTMPVAVGNNSPNALQIVSSSTPDSTTLKCPQLSKTELRSVDPVPSQSQDNGTLIFQSKSNVNHKSGVFQAQTPKGSISNKTVVSSTLSSAKTARTSVPSSKSSFAATVTTKTANGGFVTVKNPVARISNGVTAKSSGPQKLPLLLPKIDSSPLLTVPSIALRTNSACQRGNQRPRKVSQGGQTSKEDVNRSGSGEFNITVNINNALGTSTISSNGVSSSNDSEKNRNVKPSPGPTVTVTMNSHNASSNCKPQSVTSSFADCSSVHPKKLPTALQPLEKSSDEEKKVETAKAILQLSMGFKRSSTPTDPALQNRIDKIVKDLHQDVSDIKSEPISPNPSPSLSPKCSPVSSTPKTNLADKSAGSTAFKTSKDGNHLPNVNGLIITPVDSQKRKSLNAHPNTDEKRMKPTGTTAAPSEQKIGGSPSSTSLNSLKMSSSSVCTTDQTSASSLPATINCQKKSLSPSCTTSNGLKRPSEKSAPAPIPPKFPKVNKIVDTILQKQELLLQQHREQKQQASVKPASLVQTKKSTLTDQSKLILSSNLQPQVVLEKCSPEIRQRMPSSPHHQGSLSQQENGIPSQSNIQPKLPLKSQQKAPLQSQTTQLNVSPKPLQPKALGQKEESKKIAPKAASPDSPVKSKKPIPDLQRLQRPPGCLANTTVNGSMSLAEVKEQLAKNGQYSPPGQQRTPPRLLEITQQRKSAPPAPPSALHRDGYGALDLSSASPRAEHGGSWTPPPSIAQTLAKRQQQLAPSGSHKPSSLPSSSSPSPPADSTGTSVSPDLYIEQSVLAQQQALLQHIRLQSLFQAQAAGLKKAIEDWATVDRLGVKTSPSSKRK